MIIPQWLSSLKTGLRCRVVLLLTFSWASAWMTGCSGPKALRGQPPIGLITDYGTRDSYVGQLKGAILSVNPGAHLVDISHDIDPFNLLEGAFLVSESAREFPPGSIFVAVVDPGVGSSRFSILVKTKLEKYYLAPDNGLLSLVVQREGLAKAWRLDKPEFFRPGTTSSTFHGRDIYGPVAGSLALTDDPEALGTPLATLEKLNIPHPKFMGKLIAGDIIHIDHYGNLVTNIPRDFTDQFVDGKVYRITIGHQTIVAPLVKTYSDFPSVGRVLMLYNSADLLEIAINQGSASRVLHIETIGPLTIQP